MRKRLITAFSRPYQSSVRDSSLCSCIIPALKCRAIFTVSLLYTKRLLSETPSDRLRLGFQIFQTQRIRDRNSTDASSSVHTVCLACQVIEVGVGIGVGIAFGFVRTISVRCFPNRIAALSKLCQHGDDAVKESFRICVLCRR